MLEMSHSTNISLTNEEDALLNSLISKNSLRIPYLPSNIVNHMDDVLFYVCYISDLKTEKEYTDNHITYLKDTKLKEPSFTVKTGTLNIIKEIVTGNLKFPEKLFLNGRETAFHLGNTVEEQEPFPSKVFLKELSEEKKEWLKTVKKAKIKELK